MPLTAWIAGSIALFATAIFVAMLWFDSLFKAPTARRISSLMEYLGARSVLAVFAHPDDETLAAGALADAGSRADVQVRTITLTRGEAGYTEPAVARREDLPLIRESELRRYGFALGIDHQEIWEFPDGKLDSADHVITDRLIERIRTWKPDLVLTFNPAGGYNGHSDHRAAGRIATDAVRAASDGAYDPALGEPHRPQHLAYVIPPARAFLTLGGEELQAVARSQPEPNLAIPVAPRLRILGWNIHASQQLQRAYPLPGRLLFDFWDKEHCVVVGEPSGRGPI